MFDQNPKTRIEQVALDLQRLAEGINDYLGPEAGTTLLYWRNELLEALAAMEYERRPARVGY